jgi:hypothetical protein
LFGSSEAVFGYLISCCFDVVRAALPIGKSLLFSLGFRSRPAIAYGASEAIEVGFHRFRCLVGQILLCYTSAGVERSLAVVERPLVNLWGI